MSALGNQYPLSELRDELEEVLKEEALRFVCEVPRSGQLTDSRFSFDKAYYLRHRIETVHRIRLTARMDALALVRMMEENYEAACRWSRYATEEMQHDKMFLADLARHDLTESVVLSEPPLKSTFALIDFLTKRLEEIGSISVVAYSVFVEWNSARYSCLAVERAGAVFGQDFIRGSKAHLAIDIKENHYTEVMEIAHQLVSRSGSSDLLTEQIRDIAAYMRAYFVELHELTKNCRKL
jgi:hypothetical protein